MNTHREYAPSPSNTSFDAFALEYTKVRDGLPEQVRKPLDTLREEVMEICRAHGVDHPSKLVTQEAKAATKTLERVQELLEQIHYIFEHKEVPLGHKDWEVEIPKHYRFIEAVEKNGKVFFSVSNAIYFSFPPRIFDSSGHDRTLLPRVGCIKRGGLKIVGEKIACVLGHRGSNYVFLEEKNIGDYEEVKRILDTDGVLVYVAKPHGSSKEMIYVDGRVYGSPEGYDHVSRISCVGSTVAFAAQKESGDLYEVYLGDHLIGKYREVTEMRVIDGELVFVAFDFDSKAVVVKDGVMQGTGSTSSYIHSVQKINNELSWIERDVITCEEELFIGEVSYGVYQDVNKVLETRGEPLLVVQKRKGDHWMLKQGDKVIGKQGGYEVSELGKVICVSDEGVFATREGIAKSWVVESSSGKHFGSYKAIHLLKAVDDKHFIVIAEEDGKVVQRTFDIDHPPYQGEGAN